jgi:uncharacterized protein
MTAPEPFFPPPGAAAQLYLGQVMHQRLRPRAHRFQYRVYSLLIDLDRLSDASAASRFFSVDRWNLLSFRQRDHGGKTRDGLRLYIDEVLAKAGLSQRPARVLLLCYPRLLGTGFNPLAVYFAYDEAGGLMAVVYEVRNTFGETHSYVAPVAEGELSEAGLRQMRDKMFYVSPFNDLDQTYFFRLRPPGEAVSLRILQKDVAGPLLAATFHGEKQVLSTRAIFGALLRIPLLTVTVLGGIHLEAFRLWRKGLRLKHRPAPPPALSFGDARQTL